MSNAARQARYKANLQAKGGMKLSLVTPPEIAARIKSAADAAGVSVNAFILGIVSENLKPADVVEAEPQHPRISAVAKGNYGLPLMPTLGEVSLSINSEDIINHLLDEKKRLTGCGNLLSAKQLIILSAYAERMIIAREIPDEHAFGIQFHWREGAPVSQNTIIVDGKNITMTQCTRVGLIRRQNGWHVLFIGKIATPPGSPQTEKMHITNGARDFIQDRQKERKRITESRQELRIAA